MGSVLKKLVRDTNQGHGMQPMQLVILKTPTCEISLEGWLTEDEEQQP